ncbi:hypothetical protein TrLO_g6695 [Triparma laevis f. longispina]|uniref:tRNA (guanine(9)-N(1))-methyltransferase n=1 Tax=Triparma laevis f. longispina TaxID=1714387 RepID=A0A9W7F671_9STRA|nr:hypothetical protein TrLO_g6695 [Triparma laevis f. longispina]
MTTASMIAKMIDVETPKVEAATTPKITTPTTPKITTPTTSNITTPTIIFDLNYAPQMSRNEMKALANQLVLSYASNRRYSQPFGLVFSGSDFHDSTLHEALSKQDFSSWSNVSVSDSFDSSTPWQAYADKNPVYLTADSPNQLTSITSESVFIIGGLVDHKEKPDASHNRATQNNVPTARLPLLSAVQINTHNESKNNTEHVDISTLAVVQLLHSFYKFKSWPTAIYNTPSFHSAPLRKFLHWKPPYDFLNDVENGGRPYKLGAGFCLTSGESFRPPTIDDINIIKTHIE